MKKVFLEISQNWQESTCARVSFFDKVSNNFIKKEALPKVFSYEYCEMFNNTFFAERLSTLSK